MSNIIIKPLVTEKSQELSSKGKFVFVVDKKANKIQIGKAIKALYNVNVADVNTARVFGQAVSRSTRGGVVKGSKAEYKKAIITLSEGETIDIFAGSSNDQV